MSRLSRRTPLRRGAPLARGAGLIRTPFRRKPKRRSTEQDLVIAAVFVRDGGCVLRDKRLLPPGPCFGPATPHHLLKQNKGGPWTRGNLVTLCAAHNDAVEDWPHLAHSLGLVVRAGETASLAWQRMHAHHLAVGPEPGMW